MEVWKSGVLTLQLCNLGQGISHFGPQLTYLYMKDLDKILPEGPTC